MKKNILKSLFTQKKNKCFSTLSLTLLRIKSDLEVVPYSDFSKFFFSKLNSLNSLELLAYLHFVKDHVSLTNQLDEMSILRGNPPKEPNLEEFNKIKTKILQDFPTWNLAQACQYSYFFGIHKLMDIDFWKKIEFKFLENLYLDSNLFTIQTKLLEGIIARDLNLENSEILKSKLLKFLEENLKHLKGNSLVKYTYCFLKLKKYYIMDNEKENYEIVYKGLSDKLKEEIDNLDFEGLSYLNLIYFETKKLNAKFIKIIEQKVDCGIMLNPNAILRIAPSWKELKLGSINVWNSFGSFMFEQTKTKNNYEFPNVLKFIASIGGVEKDSKEILSNAVLENIDNLNSDNAETLVDAIQMLEIDSNKVWSSVEKKIESFWRSIQTENKEKIKKNFKGKEKLDFWSEI